jgi:hypothetical protein
VTRYNIISTVIKITVFITVCLKNNAKASHIRRYM